MLTEDDKEYLTKLLEHINNSLRLDIYNIEQNIYMDDRYKSKRTREKRDNIKSRQDLIDRLNMVEFEAQLDTNYDGENVSTFMGSRVAPFTDWNGNKLCESNTIAHPNGDEGIIFYDDSHELEEDRWWVAYPVGPGRLSLQIGERGQAVLKE